MPKRFRKPNPRDGQIKVNWAYEDGEYQLVYGWGPGLRKGHVIPLMNAFERISEVPWARGKTLLQTLDEDGFDITTLRFSIERKAEYEEE